LWRPKPQAIQFSIACTEGASLPTALFHSVECANILVLAPFLSRDLNKNIGKSNVAHFVQRISLASRSWMKPHRTPRSLWSKPWPNCLAISTAAFRRRNTQQEGVREKFEFGHGEAEVTLVSAEPWKVQEITGAGVAPGMTGIPASNGSRSREFTEAQTQLPLLRVLCTRAESAISSHQQ
jgi:hypothetical protein